MNFEIKKMYMIGIFGSILCFIGDMLLGCFTPLSKHGIFIFFPSFSNEWATVSSFRIVLGSILGVISLLMFYVGFYGFYLKLKVHNSKLSKIFLFGSFLFTSVGTLYHCVFGMTEWVFNRIYYVSSDLAYDVSRDMFLTFIGVAGIAAIGFLIVSVVMFISAYKRYFGSIKLYFINPLLLMFVFILFALFLPKCAIITGIFDWGQQSLSLLIVFVFLFLNDF